MTRSTGKTAMQNRILETADRLFYRQGIRAIGVDTIAAEAGISKRTLYNYFPSKDELIIAYLSRRIRPMPESSLPPAGQILGDFDRLERSFASGGFRGCPFVNAVAELKEQQHAVTKIAAAFKEQRRIWFRDLLKQLDVAHPDDLAMQLMLLVDGAIAAALVRGDAKVAQVARDAARVLLAAAGVESPAKVGPAKKVRSEAHPVTQRVR
jgi:AcrR family transcriptional regulator